MTRLRRARDRIAALELGGGRRTKEDRSTTPSASSAARSAASRSAGEVLADVHARDEESASRAADSVSPRTRSETSRRPCTASSSTSSSSSMPELPEVETIRAQLAPRLEGRTLGRVEILDPRLTRPYDLFEVAEELEGDRGRRGRAAREVPPPPARSGLGLLVHLRMTGSFGFAPVTHERAVLELDDGSRLAYRDVRRFGTWLVLEDADLEPYLAAKNGPGAARAAVHGSAGSRAQLGAAQGAPEGGAPRPARRRGPREHLRRRGALARARQPAAAGERISREAGRRAHARDPRCAARRDRAPGIDAPRLRHARRRVRLDAGRVPRLRPRRRAVPALPHDDREDARRRSRHLVLPALPAASR